MNEEIKIIELFSGIGGFSKGLTDAGFKITEHYFSEIDKHAIANYKYNFPHAKHIGSVTDISGRDFNGIDIITFGSPCQDFSIAGKGEGMDGKRSVLILEAIRLVTELRSPVFIWENVKGAFSSNSGADFWAILQAFANIGGYRLEWQLLNTKWFLPQNRERIYLVGHLDGRSKPGIFPITETGYSINERENKSRYGRKSLNEKPTLVKSANTKGYEVAFQGDSINLQNTNSSTRRGRVGKSIANTLDTECKQGVIVVQKTGGYYTTIKEEYTGTLQSGGASVMDKVPNVIQINKTGNWKGSTPDRERVYDPKGIAPYLGSSMGTGGNLVPKFLFDASIRRLTEIECERLQGFPDDWTRYGIYEKQVWINKKERTFKIVEEKHAIPRTQRYKMLGNAVTVRVVEEIARRLKESILK